jgi:hypothetical protein
MKNVTGTVEFNYKNAEGKEKTEKDTVSYAEFEHAGDVLAHLDSGAVTDVVDDEGKVTKLAADVMKERLAAFLKALNYGISLHARQKVRAVLQAKAEGPDKSINRMVDDLIKMRAADGKPISEEKARKMVLAMRAMEEEETADETAQPEAVTQ